MAFQFGGGDSQTYSFTGLGGPFSNPTQHLFGFPRTQPAPPPSVFDFSTTNLRNFTNFPTTHHCTCNSDMAKCPAAAAQPAWFLPVIILPVMPLMNYGGAFAAVQFPGAPSMAPPYDEPTKAPLFGHTCKTCSCFPKIPSTSATAYPGSITFGGPSSATATKLESTAPQHQSTIFGGPMPSSAQFFTAFGEPSSATATKLESAAPQHPGSITFGGPSSATATKLESTAPQHQSTLFGGPMPPSAQFFTGAPSSSSSVAAIPQLMTPFGGPPATHSSS